MKNATSLILAVGLLVAVGTSGAAQGFPHVPPTWGLARSTAYTLRTRELQIGVVGAGTLVRVLDSVDLRATVSLVPSVAVWLGVELRLVLGRPEVGPGGR